jgi:OOP family OmpA-OmpF porin
MKKLICFTLGVLGAAQAAAVQEYDDRWYLGAATGLNIQDSDRNTDNPLHGTVSIGRFFSPAWSVDLELNYQNPEQSTNGDLRWRQYGAEVVARRHFRDETRRWGPYLLVGIGAQHTREDVLSSANLTGERKGTNLATQFGGGLQANYGRVGLRAEVAYRIDTDDRSITAPDSTSFGDVILSAGILVPLGSPPTRSRPLAEPIPEPLPPPVVKPSPPPVEYCPDGSVKVIEGCPDPQIIALRGVHFDFDKADLRPDAIPALSDVVALFNRYEGLRAEVSGHTDAMGSASYNQRLSERRARTVYEYLIAQGIRADRLEGPIGHGEERPIASNETDEGRALNRRIELKVLP